MSENITINLTQPQEEITFSYTEQGEEIAFSFSEAARGPQGEPGSAATVDQTIIDGSTNAVSGNAVFDGLALKAPIANPTFTGIVTAPRITGRCDGLEVLCKAGLAINAGQVVYVTGASGSNIIIGLAQANAEPTSSKTIGISESTLAHNATGYVITEGLLTVSISAPTANEGDPIWLSSTTAGGMVFGLANKPSAPNHIVYLGIVTRKTGNTVVEIYVKIQNGAELDELADVAITSPVAGQALMRGASFWENRSIVANDISDSTTEGRALLTAVNAAAQRTSMGLGTAATTDSTAYATAAQGTDERVPTAAGLTSKFGTNKASIVNGDKVTILDSAASDAPKHVLWSLIVSTLTTAFNALYVGLTGNQTVAGDKTLSGQLELTGQAATNATSAMTRGLYTDEALFAISRIRNSDVATYTANAGTANLASGDNLAAGTTANARPVAFRYANINRFGSGSNNSVMPMRIASFGSYIGITDTAPKIRCAVGMPVNTSVPAANANALSGNGFGWEMYYSSSLTRMVFRLFAHDGTTYVTSSELDTGISIGSFDTFLSVIIGLNSSGTVSAWTSFANNPTTAMRPSTTATLTLAGGPTSGNFATSGVQWAVVNHSTNVASGNTQLRVLDRKLIID